MAIDDSIRNTVQSLWDTLADFDASQAEEARKHLLGGICALIGAQNASWIGAVRLGEPEPVDPVKGWRPRAIRQLHPTPLLEQMANEQSDLLEAGSVDETTIANVAGAGQYRVNRLCDLVPASWFKGDYYRVFYLGVGRRDTIWAGVPINDDAESYFGFHRGLDQAPFGTGEKEIVGFALRGLRWFHRQQMLSEGLGVASSPLTQLEQRVLRGLLRGLTEKQIAAANAQSPHTTHEYVKRILRKYGVGSRAALMALWLGKRPSP
jgi:DNA-binding CsgD family transcriptional regulator